MRAAAHNVRDVAVIGGGVAGALTAYHLLREGGVTRVTVIDPRPELGVGLAYSTPSMRHLLNVPAGKISALPSHPSHFLEWLRLHHDPQATADTFAPRAVFGRYVRTIIAGARGIEQLQARVVDLEKSGDMHVLTLDDGSRIQAACVVVATGNFDPAVLPGVEEEAVTRSLYCNDAWSHRTYADLDLYAPVTLIGTGLTAVDVLLRLRELGHRGTITAVSRHGVLPSRHAAYTPSTCSAIPPATPATCLGYLKALRATITCGTDWRAAVDSLRSMSNDLWLRLPVAEQKRFRRHLQRRWDVVRHRMAPPIADVIEAEIATGYLVIREARLAGVRAAQKGAAVALETAVGLHEVATSRVINCTGPSMHYSRVGSPLFDVLLSRGIATAGPLGGGLHTTRAGALIDSKGNASESLFNLGPGRLATLIESIAIPEIRDQAVEIARIITAKLAERVETVPAWAACSDREARVTFS